ncbi:vanadium-dependent haloperoxidase [Streptomyces albireticuli]|uniref:vanadium-dependent haloperoxidase n=1 Tax=Streptomyces albireticuli TaxID=1940 RepID=UPI00367DD69F
MQGKGSVSAPSRTAARTVVAGLTVCALMAAPAVVRAGATGNTPANDPAREAVAEWSATAVATVETDAKRPVPETFLWHAFVSTTVYNAVVGIQGGYAPYRWNGHAPRSASVPAAVATAAHHVLLEYFPASKSRLDTALAASLAKVPQGRGKDEGVAFGERAAAHTIASRKNDGRGAQVGGDSSTEPGPGVWRPTPPAHEAFATAWMGRTKPMMLKEPRQFRPGAPPSLTSARYTKDFNELKSIGRKTGSTRTPEQTDTAMFFSGNMHFQEALRDTAARRGFGVAEQARLLAGVNSAMADAIVTAWDSKLHYRTWRPITAIHEAATDGNPATAPEPSWEPLIVTPPHPDYLSGHATVGGALTRSLTMLLGTSHIDFRVRSVVTGTTRTFAEADQYNRDVVNARVWEGIHTRTADTVGNRTGQRLAAWALTRYFRPAR